MRIKLLFLISILFCTGSYAQETVTEPDFIGVPSKFTSLFFVQFNSTHLPKFSPLLSLTLFGVQSLSADC